MIIEPKILRPDAGAPFVLICDHASNHIPEAYQNLGLNPHYLATHIAWDIGAGALTKHISKDLDAVAVLARHSRLLCDTNRNIDDPTIMAESSEGIEVPGNIDLTLKEREARIEKLYLPFHRACEAVIQPRIKADPFVIGVHTFTPIYEKVKRACEISVMWNRDQRLADALGNFFEKEGFRVGWNDPYTGKILFYTMNRHGARHGLAHATVEIRQDLVQDKKGQDLFGRLLSRAFQQVRAQWDRK
jgi:predicted N-formylglutamate amidohydrolase